MTVLELTATENVSEPNVLVGFVMLKALDIRSLETPSRVFCIYDTEEGNKTHHADITCSTPRESSNSRNKAKEQERRRLLRKLFEENLRMVDSVDQLIALVREIETGNGL